MRGFVYVLVHELNLAKCVEGLTCCKYNIHCVCVCAMCMMSGRYVVYISPV